MVFLSTTSSRYQAHGGECRSDRAQHRAGEGAGRAACTATQRNTQRKSSGNIRKVVELYERKCTAEALANEVGRQRNEVPIALRGLSPRTQGWRCAQLNRADEATRRVKGPELKQKFAAATAEVEAADSALMSGGSPSPTAQAAERQVSASRRGDEDPQHDPPRHAGRPGSQRDYCEGTTAVTALQPSSPHHSPRAQEIGSKRDFAAEGFAPRDHVTLGEARCAAPPRCA
jgi:hypothetical protein